MSDDQRKKLFALLAWDKRQEKLSPRESCPGMYEMGQKIAEEYERRVLEICQKPAK